MLNSSILCCFCQARLFFPLFFFLFFITVRFPFSPHPIYRCFLCHFSTCKLAHIRYFCAWECLSSLSGYFPEGTMQRQNFTYHLHSSWHKSHKPESKECFLKGCSSQQLSGPHIPVYLKRGEGEKQPPSHTESSLNNWFCNIGTRECAHSSPIQSKISISPDTAYL